MELHPDHPLTLHHLESVGHQRTPVHLSLEALARIREGRRRLENLQATGRPIYGVNTGVGRLATTRVSEKELEGLQINIIRSHAVGVGQPLPPEVVRMVLLLRLSMLARGYSGVRVETAEWLLRLLNEDVIPVVPGWGSVGASGDLAPLAHIARVLLGEGEVLERGKRRPTVEVFQERGWKPWRPASKEGLALINGTQVSTALLVETWIGLRRLMEWATVVAALTHDALLGLPDALDPDALSLRAHPGILEEGARLRTFLEGSSLPRDPARVQDAYSLRCTPQIQGTSRMVLRWIQEALERECNAVTDNPLVLDHPPRVISCGNFHGAPVALLGDLMMLAMVPVAVLSERRTFRLLSPELSQGLPPFLTTRSGLESGLMMLQVTQAALIGRLRDLSYPSSVGSIPTSANQEDVVPMATNAAHRALEGVRWTAHILAGELLAALRALHIRDQMGEGIPVPLYRRVRELLPADLPVTGDHPWGVWMERLAEVLLTQDPPVPGSP